MNNNTIQNHNEPEEDNNEPEIEDRISILFGGIIPPRKYPAWVNEAHKKARVNAEQRQKERKTFVTRKPESNSNILSLWNIIRYTLAAILILFLLIMAYNHNKPL